MALSLDSTNTRGRGRRRGRSRRALSEINVTPLVDVMLVLLIFCPISSMSTVFCGKLNCDPDVYGTAASLTIPISVAVMVGLGALWAV